MIKKISSFSLIIIGAAMLVIPVIWLITVTATKYSSMEERSLETFPHLSFQNFKTATKQMLSGDFSKAKKLFYGQFLNQSFQKDLANAVADQFPYRLKWIDLSRMVERTDIQVAYLWPSEKVIPVSGRISFLVTRDGKRLMPYPVAYTKARRQAIDTRIQNYTDLIERYPQLNFFAFYIEKIEYSKFHPLLAYYPNADRGRLFEYFIEHKPEKLVVGSLIASNFQEYDSWFYRTDHHWNAHGSWQAYQEIYNMIAPYYPDISPMLQVKQFLTVPGLEFCGSYARETLYPCQPDKIEYADVDLPPYTVYVDGEPVIIGDRDNYLKGIFSADKYDNHDAEFFGKNYSIQRYEFENDSNHNLLIIVNSFARQIQALVASHFHTTIVVDLRYPNDFTLEKMVQQYGITDVLVLGDKPVNFDEDWVIKP